MNSSGGLFRVVQRLQREAAAALAIVQRAGAIIQESYHAHDKSTAMQEAATEYRSFEHACRCWPALANCAVHLSEAVSQHAVGEAAYFGEDFELAERCFQKAGRLAGLASSALSDERCALELKQELKTILAYVAYYEIEAMEARANLLRASGDVAGAAVVHVAEIQHTKSAASLPTDDAFLRGFFSGHVWYAQASLLRCRAEEERLQGNGELAMRLVSEAEAAEQRSVELNAQWRE